MNGITLAHDERELASTKVSPSVLLFWLKTELAVSNQRVGWRAPNTILGLIPLGYSEETTPLANTASVNVDVKFSLGRLIWGGFLFILGLTLLGQDGLALLGFILVLFGLASLANAFSAALNVRNNGGAVTSAKVSVFEKAKLEAFKNEVQKQLLTNHGQLRHEESMGMQQAQLFLQQAQLNAQLGLQQPPAPVDPNATLPLPLSGADGELPPAPPK